MCVHTVAHTVWVCTWGLLICRYGCVCWIALVGVSTSLLCVQVTVVGAGHPTRGRLGGGDNLHRSGRGKPRRNTHGGQARACPGTKAQSQSPSSGGSWGIGGHSQRPGAPGSLDKCCFRTRLQEQTTARAEEARRRGAAGVWASSLLRACHWGGESSPPPRRQGCEDQWG